MISFQVAFDGEQWVVNTYIDGKYKELRYFDDALQVSGYMERVVIDNKSK